VGGEEEEREGGKDIDKDIDKIEIPR